MLGWPAPRSFLGLVGGGVRVRTKRWVTACLHHVWEWLCCVFLVNPKALKPKCLKPQNLRHEMLNPNPVNPKPEYSNSNTSYPNTHSLNPNRKSHTTLPYTRKFILELACNARSNPGLRYGVVIEIYSCSHSYCSDVRLQLSILPLPCQAVAIHARAC